MRYLLSISFLSVCLHAHSKNLDLDFVPYNELTDVQKSGVSQSCSGRFVNGFNEYTQDMEEDGQKTTSKNQNLQDQTWILDGDVQIIQKSIVMLSDSIEYNQLSGQSTLNGDPQLRFGNLMLQGESAQMDLSNNTGVIKNAKFVIYSSNINGTADEISRDEDGVFHLKGFSISRCNPDQRAWWLKGSSLKINPNTGMITSVNNFLWVAGVPVFYTPYIHMPYDDHATSGLLVPTFTLSDGKISEFNQPIYFRIKPNLDMTTTVSYLSQSILQKKDNETDDDVFKEKDGWLINNELRFLGWKQKGTLLGAYTNMPSATIGDNLKTVDRFYLNFEQQWDLDWFTSDIELNALSDEYFFQDFYAGSEVDSADQSIQNVYKIDNSVIKQSLIANWALDQSDEKFHMFQHELNTKELGWDMYFKQHWQRVDSRKFNAVDPVTLEDFEFQLSPAFEGNYRSTNTTALKFNQNVKFQIANFDRQLPQELEDDEKLSEQLRIAAKANYTIPYKFNIGSTDATYHLQPGIMLQAAIYPGFDPEDDDLNSGYINSLSTIKQSMTIPTALDEQYQFLWQPEFIWQYAPFVDSSYLPVLDSENSTSSYGNSIRFTGLDRLGDTQEIHYGLTMKFQKNKRDYARLSVKQSRLFDQELLSLQSVQAQDDEFERFSDYSVQAGLNPNSNTRVSGNWVYSPDWNIRTGELSINYNLPSKQYVRFTSYSGYELSSDDEPVNQLNTHLLSLSGQWALNHQIGLIGYGKWQLDVADPESKDYQLEEVAFGLEYDDCCWAVRMLSYNNFLDEEHEDNKIHFQIVFKGMGRLDQGFDAVIDKYLPAYPGSLFEQE